ncbi:T9SS type A sorting domain-containing protein [candidate division KSB1 bacterium]|nr:T9SS type A sorting domain-containing protein [candidate division KSB1 bacterium]
MLKRLLIVILLGGLLLGASNLYAAQPKVTSAAYFDSLNVLQFVFDQPVYNDVAHVIRDGIAVKGYFLDQYHDFRLTGGTLEGDPKSPTLTNTVNLTVTFSDQKTIEHYGYTNSEGLWLIMPEGRFINEQNEGNSEVTLAEDLKIAFYPYVNKPQPVKVSYDAAVNKLGIKFDKVVQAKDAVDFSKVSLLDDGGNSLTFTGAQEFINQIVATDSVIIDFTPKHQQVIENELNTAALSLALGEYAFLDALGNTNKIIAAGSVGVSYVPDTQPTLIDSANYNAKDNTLRIYCNEKVVSTYKRYYYEGGKKLDETLDAINYTGIAVFDPVSNTTARLTGSKSVSIKSDVVLEIMVMPADQILMETFENTSDLKLTLAEYSILDGNLNGIQAFDADDNIRVSYEAESAADAPVVTEAFYNATTNQLQLNFGNIKPQTKGIDTTSVTLSWITLHNASDVAVSLSGGSVHGVKAGVPKFVREIYIDILPEDELKIERLSRGDDLTLSLKPLTFFFESYARTGNGNHELPADSQLVVKYLPDSTGAEITKLKYDFNEDQLAISFNKRIKYSAFDPKDLEIGGVRLSGGSISDTSYTIVDTVYNTKSVSYQAVYAHNLLLDVVEADQALIEALSVEKKADLEAKLAANSIMNLDEVPNLALDVVNGDTTSTNEIIFVGYGRSFWDQSFEAFPTLDILVPASLRAVGDHCYIFVADDQWLATYSEGDEELQIITQAMVDSFLLAFEESTPANPNKGIHGMCNEYFGQDVDTDGDPRITILFTDLRDEYGQGRANRASDVPKAGAFLKRNTQPADSLTPHSAASDMIFVDTEPIIRAGTALQSVAQYYTHLILNGIDPDEEQWLIEGLGGLAPVLCGYNFTSHRFPGENPKMAAEKILNYWTGWNGGTPDIDIMEFYHTALFHLYLYEQFGGDIIKALAASQANGLASVRNVLPASITLEELFDDYAVAGFQDILDHPTFGDKYGFKTVDLGYPTLGSITWVTENVYDNQPQWSFSFYKTGRNQAINNVKFNGNDATNMDVIFVTLRNSEFGYTKAVLNEVNESSVDISDVILGDILTVVTSKSSNGPTYSDYVLSKDIQPPSYVHLNIVQNTSVTQNLNVFVTADEPLYLDVPAEGAEGPKIAVTLGQTEQILEVKNYFTGQDGSVTYLAQHSLAANGDYTVRVSGQDQAGNDFTELTSAVAVNKVLANTGGTISYTDQSSRLTLLPNSLQDDIYMTVSKYNDQEENYLSDIYRYGPEKMNLAIPAKLTIGLDDPRDEAVAIYVRKDDNSWIKLGGDLNAKQNQITVYTGTLGDFVVMADDEAFEIEPQLPRVFSLSQNYPNPFNPTTSIHYTVPGLSHVRLDIYNLLGQRVAELVNKNQEAGIYHLNWDAKDLTSGMYFYKISARNLETGESFAKTMKMMLMK